MKTKADLDALIPTLVDLLTSQDPGDYWTPPSSDLRKAWGEVTEILVSHYDDDTDEESEFEEDDLKDLWSAIDKELEDIA